jgi:ribosomal protein L7Ae-like RNA K-turn-binding protein
MIDDAAKRKILGLAGLGIRGRLAVVGVQQARDAAKRGRLKLALVANDASQNSLDKVASLLSAKGVTTLTDFTAAELGAVAGRESVAVIGVSDAGLSRGILAAVAGRDSEVEVAVAAQATRHSGRRDSRR